MHCIMIWFSILQCVQLIREECISYVLDISDFKVVIEIVVSMVHIVIGHYYYFFILYMGLLPFIKNRLPKAGLVHNIITTRDI